MDAVPKTIHAPLSLRIVSCEAFISQGFQLLPCGLVDSPAEVSHGLTRESLGHVGFFLRATTRTLLCLQVRRLRSVMALTVPTPKHRHV